MGSRLMVLIPAFALIKGLSEVKLNYCKIILYVLLAFVSLVIAIQFRRLDSHGLIPYLYNLIQNGIDVDLVMFIIHYTFTFSFGLTTFLIENLEYQPEYLIYSLHILPSSLLDSASEIEKCLRVNKFIPYNGLSEVFFVKPVGLFYFFIAGIILKSFESALVKLSTYFKFVSYGFVLWFTFSTLQYNLRGCTRILYYSLIINLLAVFLLSLSRRIKT